ncbi:MAG: hypothetical protein AAGD28_06395 [Bacteroidota bacterium]
MLHTLLGYWKGRMLSAFGYGDKQNIAYGALNLVISLSLYLYKHGVDHLLSNGIYLGAVAVLLIVLVFGRFLYQMFNPSQKS